MIGICRPHLRDGQGVANGEAETTAAARRYGHSPQGRTETVPSGCSQVIVPLDVIVARTGCVELPLAGIGIDVVIVQS